jgi:hypothetical protein
VAVIHIFEAPVARRDPESLRAAFTRCERRRGTMDDQKIAALKAEHGNSLVLLELGDHELVVKKPTRAQFNRFRESVAEGGKARIEGGSQLIRDCLVHPSWGEYLKLAEDSPAIEDEITGEIAKLAKSAEKLVVKKF